MCILQTLNNSNTCILAFRSNKPLVHLPHPAMFKTTHSQDYALSIAAASLSYYASACARYHRQRKSGKPKIDCHPQPAFIRAPAQKLHSRQPRTYHNNTVLIVYTTSRRVHLVWLYPRAFGQGQQKGRRVIRYYL